MTEARVDADPSLDRYARMVRRTLDVPVALVSILQSDLQVFPGASGLPEPVASERETPLSHSFCQHVVITEAPLIVNDARENPLVRDNLAVRDLSVVAYAGFPLTNADDQIIGSLCAIDFEPRAWTEDDLEALADLAAACSAELSHRELKQVAERQAHHANDLQHRGGVLLGISEALAAPLRLSEVAAAVEQVALETLGCMRAGLWLRDAADAVAEVASEEPVSPYRVPAQRVRTHRETLRFVEGSSQDWPTAVINSSLGLDVSNPIGETLVRRKPMFYPTRAEQNAVYPHLATPAQVGEARAFVPLSVGGQSFGTLVLLWPGEREFTADDQITVTALTAHVAQAVQRAVLLQERMEASATLQGAMLTQLPTADGVALAAEYRPAGARDKVGGDWYDAVVLGSGDISLTIGDVAGHDIAAAGVMGELRSMLRALAWAVDDRPSAHVSRLDRAMRDFDIDRFATLVFARIGPPDAGTGVRRIQWTNAGHLPPLLVHADGNAELLDDGQPADIVLGVSHDSERRDQVAWVPPGSTLLLYTDGLIERRGEDLHAGIARLRAHAGRLKDLKPDEFIGALIEELVGRRHEDDIAMLAVRFN
jgi:serine phosphatase RsbU (regulator of sigma subunit)